MKFYDYIVTLSYIPYESIVNNTLNETLIQINGTNFKKKYILKLYVDERDR